MVDSRNERRIRCCSNKGRCLSELLGGVHNRESTILDEVPTVEEQVAHPSFSPFLV